MKIVSLLPSATEIVCALGLGDQLAGVSFECDYPEAARRVPVVSGTALDADRERTAAEVDAQVSAMLADGRSIYTLHDAKIPAIAPDVILAQDRCAPSTRVPSRTPSMSSVAIAQVVSLDPAALDDVIDCVAQVGRATGTEEVAAAYVAGSGSDRRRYAHASTACRGQASSSSNGLTPPFNGDHWMPEMVEAAGGEPVLAEVRAPSRRLTWEEIGAESIDERSFRRAASILPVPWSRRRPSWVEQTFPTWAMSSRSTPTPSSHDPVRAW